MEPFVIVAMVILVGFTVLLAGAVSYRAGEAKGRREAEMVPLEPSDDMLVELADLRHLRAQLEAPPPARHEHIWPREPDVRKPRWLRFKCAYANCPAIQWVPAS